MTILLNNNTSRRIRIRKCGTRLRVPIPNASAGAEAVFVCQLEAHHDNEQHTEHGFVFMDNGTHREFTISWRDGGVASLRRRRRP